MNLEDFLVILLVDYYNNLIFVMNREDFLVILLIDYCDNIILVMNREDFLVILLVEKKTNSLHYLFSVPYPPCYKIYFSIILNKISIYLNTFLYFQSIPSNLQCIENFQ